jgi:hypothetical protein
MGNVFLPQRGTKGTKNEPQIALFDALRLLPSTGSVQARLTAEQAHHKASSVQAGQEGKKLNYNSFVFH